MESLRNAVQSVTQSVRNALAQAGNTSDVVSRAEVCALEEVERQRRIDHPAQSHLDQENAKRVSQLVNNLQFPVLNGSSGYKRFTRICEENERRRRLSNKAEYEYHKVSATKLAGMIHSIGWPFIMPATWEGAEYIIPDQTLILEEQERNRRMNNPMFCKASKQNAASVAVIARWAHFKRNPLAGTKRYTRRLEENERKRRLADTQTQESACEHGYAEARCIRNLGYPFFVQSRESRADTAALESKERARRVSDIRGQQRARHHAATLAKMIAAKSEHVDIAKVEEAERARRLDDEEEQSLSYQQASAVSNLVIRNKFETIESNERERRLNDDQEELVSRINAHKVADIISQNVTEQTTIQEAPLPVAAQQSATWAYTTSYQPLTVQAPTIGVEPSAYESGSVVTEQIVATHSHLPVVAESIVMPVLSESDVVVEAPAPISFQKTIIATSQPSLTVTTAPVVYQTPVQAPVIQAPVIQAPVIQAPVIQTPVIQTPVIQTPVIQTHVFQTPVMHTPVIQAPVIQTPVIQAHVIQTPVIQAPVIQAPVFQAHVIQAPVVSQTIETFYVQAAAPMTSNVVSTPKDAPTAPKFRKTFAAEEAEREARLVQDQAMRLANAKRISELVQTAYRDDLRKSAQLYHIEQGFAPLQAPQQPESAPFLGALPAKSRKLLEKTNGPAHNGFQAAVPTGVPTTIPTTIPNFIPTTTTTQFPIMTEVVDDTTYLESPVVTTSYTTTSETPVPLVPPSHARGMGVASGTHTDRERKALAKQINKHNKAAAKESRKAEKQVHKAEVLYSKGKDSRANKYEVRAEQHALAAKHHEQWAQDAQFLATTAADSSLITSHSTSVVHKAAM